jgi:hypothetical protein
MVMWVFSHVDLKAGIVVSEEWGIIASLHHEDISKMYKLRQPETHSKAKFGKKVTKMMA